MSDPTPTPAEPTGPPAEPTALKRRSRRRIWAAVLIGVAIVLVGAVAAAGIYGWSLNKSVSENIRRDNTLPTEDAGRPSTSPEDVTGALDFVLLGSDSRDPDDSGEGRSDSIMVVHLNEARNRAYITSFPRDMWVEVPGHGMNKINAAFAFGGAPLMVRTLEKLLDARMDHVVLVDFAGFIALTEGLGGITVTNKTAFTSHGFDYPKGQITIKGEEALWFVRERKSLPGGDFDRAENQRNVIKAIVAKGLSPQVVSDPARFTAFVSGVAQHVTVDQKLSDAEIRSIAFSLRLKASNIELLQAPITGTGTSPDGQSIDVVDTDKIDALGKAIRRDTMDAYLKKYPKG